jgi:hypothetical protein
VGSASARGFENNLKVDTSVSEINKGRLIGVSATGIGGFAITMTGLYQLWYKDYPQSSFHFINDNKEWLYMDKIGHSTTSYWLGRIGYQSLRWSGVSEKQAVWIGGLYGFLCVSTIELFDGFSAEWGASWGDIIFNTAGTFMFVGQQLLWKDQRFMLKFSYSPSEYAQYNPELLGKTGLQRIIKDYNGQTYWLSANIRSFIKKETKFPAWLNVAFGYGADGMIGAGNNPEYVDGAPVPEFQRTSQYYLTLDIDLTRIKTKSETVKLLLNLVGFIKIPFPTLEYNSRDGFKYHWLYF